MKTKVTAIETQIRRTRDEFTPDGIAYALRFSVKVSKYDVLDVIDLMPNVQRVSYTLYRAV